VSAIASAVLYVKRLPLLEAEATLESMVSREASFLFNNLLLIASPSRCSGARCFRFFPRRSKGTKNHRRPAVLQSGERAARSRAARDDRDRPADRVAPGVAAQSAPPIRRAADELLFVLLILLVAGMRDIGALIAFSIGGFVLAAIVQEFARGARARHRQYGEPVIVGSSSCYPATAVATAATSSTLRFVLLFVAFAGMAFKTETQATLRPGETATLQGPDGHVYSFTQPGHLAVNALNRQVTAALLDVRGTARPWGACAPKSRQHVDALGNPTFEPSTEVGIMTGCAWICTSVLAGLVNGTEQAVFRFTINPLVWWVWFAASSSSLVA